MFGGNRSFYSQGYDWRSERENAGVLGVLNASRPMVCVFVYGSNARVNAPDDVFVSVLENVNNLMELDCVSMTWMYVVQKYVNFT